MKKKRGQRFSIHINDELKEIFVGHHTLFSVIGFTVGGILVGETLKEWLHIHFGLPATLIVGFVLILLTGITLHKFSDMKLKKEEAGQPE
jgi:fucose permease